MPGTASSSGGGAATLGYNSNTRLTPLTVGFHEPQFLSVINAENAELVQFGPPAFWNGEVRRDHIVPMGPINPQALNRYAYCLNNALRYVDPSGHNALDENLGYEPLLDENGDQVQVMGDDGKWHYVWKVWWNDTKMYVLGNSEAFQQFQQAVKDRGSAYTNVGLGLGKTGAGLAASGFIGLALAFEVLSLATPASPLAVVALVATIGAELMSLGLTGFEAIETFSAYKSFLRGTSDAQHWFVEMMTSGQAPYRYSYP